MRRPLMDRSIDTTDAETMEPSEPTLYSSARVAEHLEQTPLPPREAPRSRMSRCRHYLGMITCEPIILLVGINAQLSIAQSLAMFYVACYEIYERQMKDSVDMKHFCTVDVYNANHTYSTTVEKRLTMYNMYNMLLATAITLVVAPLINSLSDAKLGRRLPILFCLVGWICDTLCSLYLLYDFRSYRNIFPLMLVFSFFTSFTGNSAVFTSMLTSMVSDDVRHRSDPESLQMRLIVMQAVTFVGYLTGTGTTRIFQGVFGVPDYYIISAYVRLSILVLAFLYGVFVMRETHFPHRMVVTEGAEGFSIVRLVMDTLHQYKRAFAAAFRPRVGWYRFCLILSIMFAITEFLESSPTILGLRLRLPPFSFSDADLTDLALTVPLLNLIGLFAVPMLLRLLRVPKRTTVIILLAVGTHVVCATAIGVAWQGWQVFVAIAVNTFLSAAYNPTLGAFVIEFVEEDETARVYGMVTILDAFVPFIQSAGFMMLYRWSLSWYPSFYFILCAATYALVFIGQV